MIDVPGCADSTSCRLSFDYRCSYKPCHVNPGGPRLVLYIDDDLIWDSFGALSSCSTWSTLSVPLSPGRHSVVFFGRGDPAWTELIDNVRLSNVTPVRSTTWGHLKSQFGER